MRGGRLGGLPPPSRPKKVYSQKQEREVVKPTLKGSTWQLDLINGRNLGSTVAVFAMVAADVATRKIYGELMRGNTTEDIIDAFDRLIAAYDPDDDEQPAQHPDVPAMIDMDKEAAWTNERFRQHILG